MRAILLGAAIVGLGAGCPRREEAPARPIVDAAPAVARVDAAAATGDLRREDFERIDAAFSGGTSKLCGRGAFLPDNDLRAFSAGDFLGRAASLFGAHERGSHQIVLRHKPTGIVVTVYFGASGAAYGGGPVYRGALPQADLQALMRDQLRRMAARATERRNDAEEARRRAETEAAMKSGRMNEVERLLCERADPPGFARVARGLEALIAAAPLTEFEDVFETDDGPYRMGVRGGNPFEEKVIDRKRK